jgi:hypothetical protein
MATFPQGLLALKLIRADCLHRIDTYRKVAATSQNQRTTSESLRSSIQSNLVISEVYFA